MHAYKTMIATNRFGLGARPGEAAAVASDPQGWLLAQLEGPRASVINDTGLVNSQQALGEWYEFQSVRRQAQRKAAGDEDKVREAMSGVEKPRALVAREVAARTRFAVTTEQSFRERLVRFWANHFTVSMTNNNVVMVAGAFEREAVRPHVTGFFADMLQAAETHPAMLLYLDNTQSVGPNSRAGRRRGRGLNENLAREILELHTVGVDGGYTQEDVTEFAKILTGWTVGSPRDRQPTGKPIFDENRHEPGSHKVMGKKYSASGSQQALEVFRDLAMKPETARFIATKLACHFIADEPPPAAIEQLAKAYLKSAGNLKTVSAELVNLSEAWVESPVKFKTPEEFYLSVLRGLGTKTVNLRSLRGVYQSLGQMPFSAPSPAGWPDQADAWLGPDAVKKRLEWSQAVAGRLGRRNDPRLFLAETMGASASERTRFMVKGADSMKQGLTLAMMAPEFQRR